MEKTRPVPEFQRTWDVLRKDLQAGGSSLLSIPGGNPERLLSLFAKTPATAPEREGLRMTPSSASDYSHSSKLKTYTSTATVPAKDMSYMREAHPELMDTVNREHFVGAVIVNGLTPEGMSRVLLYQSNGRWVLPRELVDLAESREAGSVCEDLSVVRFGAPARAMPWGPMQARKGDQSVCHYTLLTRTSAPLRRAKQSLQAVSWKAAEEQLQGRDLEALVEARALVKSARKRMYGGS